MSLKSFSTWLYDTPASQLIQNKSWIIPTVQSIHIVAIAALFGSAIVLDLKLAGIVARSESAAVVFRRYMPWLWGGLVVLLLTGTVMVVGEPERALLNWVFWTKMGLVLLAFFLTLAIRMPMLRADLPGASPALAIAAKPLGIVALLVWVAIIFCGRWIAYAM